MFMLLPCFLPCPALLPRRRASAPTCRAPEANLRIFRDFRRLPDDSDDEAPPSFEPLYPPGRPIPLLPPFRPTSPEDDFAFHATRVRKREAAAGPPTRVVAIAADHATLYAEVIRDAPAEGQMWLRPLMLREEDDSDASCVEWVDLRATSDFFLPGDAVDGASVDAERKTVLDVMLAAGEGDLEKRVLGDEVESDVFRVLLADFLLRFQKEM